MDNNAHVKRILLNGGNGTRARAASHRPRNSLPAVRPRPPAHVTQHKDRRHAAACTLPSGPITSFLFPPLSRRIEPGLAVGPVALENRLRSLLPTDVPFPFMLLAMLAEELDSFDERGGVLVWEAGGKCAEPVLRPIVEGAPRLLDKGGVCDNASCLASGVEVTAEGARASGVSLDLSPPCGVAGAGAGDAPRPACDPFPRESPERESASDGGLSSVEGEGPASVVAAAAGFRRPCARASSMSMLSLLPVWPSTSNSPSGVPWAPGYLNETSPLVETVSDDKEHCRTERSEPHQSLSASTNRDTAAGGLPLPLSLSLSLSLRVRGGRRGMPVALTSRQCCLSGGTPLGPGRTGRGPGTASAALWRAGCAARPSRRRPRVRPSTCARRPRSAQLRRRAALVVSACACNRDTSTRVPTEREQAG